MPRRLLLIYFILLKKSEFWWKSSIRSKLDFVTHAHVSRWFSFFVLNRKVKKVLIIFLSQFVGPFSKLPHHFVDLTKIKIPLDLTK